MNRLLLIITAVVMFSMFFACSHPIIRRTDSAKLKIRVFTEGGKFTRSNYYGSSYDYGEYFSDFGKKRFYLTPQQKREGRYVILELAWMDSYDYIFIDLDTREIEKGNSYTNKKSKRAILTTKQIKELESLLAKLCGKNNIYDGYNHNQWGVDDGEISLLRYYDNGLKNEFGGYALALRLEEEEGIDITISKGRLLPQRNLNRTIIQYIEELDRVFQ
jgi:hypothetical protein